MKKLVSLLLVFVMLLGVLCSCNDTGEDVNIPSDDTNTLISEDKPNDGANTPSEEDKPNDKENIPNDDNKSSEDANTPTDENKPSDEENKTNDEDHIGKLSNIRGDGEVIYGKTGERALYVKSWDKSFPLPNDCNVKDCLIVENYIWVVLFDYDNDCATTMKISRDGETSESYNYTFPVETCYDESTRDSWVFNCYKEDCFYAFFMDASEVKNGNRYSYYTVTTFKSLDYGKTWTKEPGLQAGIGDWNAGPEMFKFVSRDVGFIVYYDAGRDYSDFTVYATSNGGATWDIQRFNIKDNSEDYFRSFKKLQATEDGYVATFEVSPRGEDGWDYGNAETLKYFSSDLKIWKIIE